MGVLGLTAISYADWAARLDPKGKVPAIVEILSQLSPEVADALVTEGNLPTGHQTTIRSGLPLATWRMLNYGVQPSKSTVVKVTDSCGMLENYAQIDKSIADLNGNTAAFRLSEDVPFLEGMTQEFTSTFWYGNETTAPAEFTGMTPRYNQLGSTGTQKNTISAGGTAAGAVSSIWLMTWGEQQTHLIFPNGQKAGLHSEDKGQQTVLDANGGMYEAYRTHYKWDVGLVVRDWRYNVRICNVDPALCVSGAMPDLVTSFARAIRRVQSMATGRLVAYCNRDVATGLDRLLMTKATTTAANEVSKSELTAGGVVSQFMGVPVHVTDALVNTETVVTT